MIKNLLPALLLCLATVAQAQYLETFSTPNKGYLLNNVDDFSGVGWTLSPWDVPSGNRDVSDYFQTTAGGVLESIDLDQEVCWTSPLLTVSATGNIAFTADISWEGFDVNQTSPTDGINIEYQINGGAWVRHPNVLGANGDPTYTVRYINGVGPFNSSATTNFASIAVTAGNSFRVRMCASDNANAEIVRLDNVNVTGVTAGCAAPNISTTTTQAGSCNNANGSIKVTASGATPGYNVAWSGPSSGNPGGIEIGSSGGMYTILPLTSGTYTITVTDAASCTATTTATVTTAAAMSLSTQVLNTTCNGVNDGEINLSVGNGVPPYSYSWSNLPGSPDPQDQTGLATGTYTVTVTDNAGCTATTSATVGVAAPGAYLETFSIANRGYLPDFIDDFAGVNWTLSSWTVGGFGRQSEDFFRTSGGALVGQDFDQEICWTSPVIDIDPPGSGIAFSVDLAWTGFDNDPFDYINVNYSLDGGGYTTVPNAVGGGAGTIQYISAGPNNGSTTISVNALSGGSLQIQVCGNFNSDLETMTIDNVSVPGSNGLFCPCPTITFTATPTNTCSGSSNGQIVVSGVSGGTGPYMYSKDNGANFQSGATFTGLAAGMYNVVVKDANACVSAATQVTVGTFSVPACTVTGPDFVCNNTAGNVYSAPGGMSAYNWGISGGGSIPGSTTGSSVSVTSGNYLNDYTVSVTVTDANGCTSSCSKQSFIYLAKPPADITANPNPVCLGAILDLSITAAASSTVSWTGEGITNPSGNPSTTAIPTTTGPHVYSVMVTTDQGCSATSSATVNVTNAVFASATPTNPLCFGQNGKITVNISGGTGPYDIAWDGPGLNDGSTLNKPSGYMIINLPAGGYLSTVTDENGCTDTAYAAITAPPELVITDTVSNVNCTGDANGKIELRMNGGVPPYDIVWDGPGAMDSSVTNKMSPYMITGLPAGTYNITVTDDNGCTKTHTSTVNTSFLIPECSISDPMATVCPMSMGNQYSGPAGMDSYAWGIIDSGKIVGPTNGQSIQVTAGSFGMYTVTLTVNKSGCTSSCSKTVDIEMQPFLPMVTPQYCEDDPGPVIGLNGSEMGVVYRLQSGGNIVLDSAIVGTGSTLVFGAFPNGVYQIQVMGGLCDAVIPVTADASATNCMVAIPDFCSCNAPGGYSPATVKVTAPEGQNWTVVDVIGLYGADPYPQITLGTPLNYVGGNMYILNAFRDNNKGYYVKVSNGFTEKQIQVGNPSW